MKYWFITGIIGSWLLLAGFPTVAQVVPSESDTPWSVGDEATPFALPADNISDKVSMLVTPEFQAVSPGQIFHLAVKITIHKDWIFYGPKQFSDFYTAGKLHVRADGWATGEIRWPQPKKKMEDPTFSGKAKVPVYYYRESFTAFVPVTVPASATVGSRLKIRLTPEGQLCSAGESGQCLQVPADGVSAEVTITVAAKAVANPAWAAERYDLSLNEATTAEKSATEEDISFPLALLIALLAGLLLNIMPCVLPVIPIRIYSLVQMAGESRRRYVTLGLTFAAGIVLFFAALAAVNIALKLTHGTSLSLNTMLTTPWIVVLLSAVLVAVAANLFGVFNVIVPTKVASLETSVQAGRAGHLKSVAMGLMMAVLATPCSFGFLAVAMTFAQTAPIWQGTMVFLVVGIGMAVPHILLASFPQLIDYLPKPGAWMEWFKQGCGFVLLLIVVWLISVLRGEGSSYPFWVMAWFVVVVMGLWIWANWVRYDASWKKKLIVRGVAVALVVATGAWMLPQETKYLEAQRFDLAAIEKAQRDGKVVVVKFESNTCTKCVLQEKFVFNMPETAEFFVKQNVAFFKGNIDMTPEAKQWLIAQGFGTAVPRTVIYPPGDGPFATTVDLDQEKLFTMIERAKGETINPAENIR